MSEPKIISYWFDDEAVVRTVTDPDETLWVVGADLCQAKKLAQTIYSDFDESLRSLRSIPTKTGRRNLVVLNEAGLRRVMATTPTRLDLRDHAERFNSWATEVLLPLFRPGDDEVEGASHAVPEVPPVFIPPAVLTAQAFPVPLTAIRPHTLDFDGHQVRYFFEDGVVWFVGADICTALGHSNSRQALMRLVEGLEKGSKLVDTPGGPQMMTVINEPGLNQLLLTSNVEKAKRLRHLLAHDVLPSLNRHGSYFLPGASPSPVEAGESDPLLAALDAARANYIRTKQIERDVQTLRGGQVQIVHSVGVVEQRMTEAEARLREAEAKAIEAEARMQEARARAEESESRAREAADSASRAQKDANRAVRTVTGETDCFCLVPWAEMHGIKLVPPHDGREGKILAAFCRAHGVEPSKIAVPRHPKGVNVAPERFLKMWLESYRQRHPEAGGAYGIR